MKKTAGILFPRGFFLLTQQIQKTPNHGKFHCAGVCLDQGENPFGRQAVTS
jgi:hypothetical protein